MIYWKHQTDKKEKGNWDARNKTQLFGSTAIFCFFCYIEILQGILNIPMALMLKKNTKKPYFESCESLMCCLQYRNCFLVQIKSSLSILKYFKTTNYGPSVFSLLCIYFIVHEIMLLSMLFPCPNFCGLNMQLFF